MQILQHIRGIEMKVENKFVIDGHPVEEVFKSGKFKVYEYGNDVSKIIYFTESEIVITRLNISADMGQGVGYISDCRFDKIA